MQAIPLADAVPVGEDKGAISSQAKRKFSGSLANDTKWNELLQYVRGMEGWRPLYRSKWVNGHVSGWDADWYYHLPLPFVGVEWFDLRLHEHDQSGKRTQSRITDHSKEFASVLENIGFDFEIKGDVARIWGYFPKSYDDFPPSA